MKRALIITAVVLLLVAMIGMAARADYELALHLNRNQCWACRQEEPDEDSARAAGVDIRRVDCTAHPEFGQAYKATKYPVVVYVIERDGKSYDSGRRLRYPYTTDQLKRFAIAPGVVTVGAAVRNAVRSLFTPIPIFVP